MPIVIIERWGKKLSKGGKCGALFTTLYSLQHALLFAKLEAYEFSYKLISRFVSKRKYRTKRLELQ